MNSLSIKILSLGIILAAFTVLPVEGTFTLVDRDGNALKQGEFGLLLFNGGTVCDDFFNVNAANAICHFMGYTGATKWDSGIKYDIQSQYRITLDNVMCTRGEWSNCTYSKFPGPWVSHRDDVFLSCSEQCPAGSYQPVNQTFCKFCEGNAIRSEGSCKPCGAGSIAIKDKTECDSPPVYFTKWHTMKGGLTVVSKGKAGTWGINKYGHVYNLIWVNGGRGYYWRRIAGNLVDISVGYGVWGLRDRNIYTYEGNHHWERIPGSLINVAASDNGHVWGVSPSGRIWRYTGGTNWQEIEGVEHVSKHRRTAAQVTVGLSGVWVVNCFVGEVFYRRGTYGDVDSAGTGWTHIPGKLKWISSGRNVVFGVAENGDTYYRAGMSKYKPTGTEWVRIINAPGKMRMIEVYGDQVMGTYAGNSILEAKLPRSITN